MRCLRVVLPVVLMFPALPLMAQQTASANVAPVAKGSVSGHVICADTRKPARFADVALVRKEESVPVPAGGRQSIQAIREAAMKAPQMLLLAKARTALDGSFTVDDLPEGDYYAVATMAGYIIPVVLARGQDQTGHSNPAEAMANFPVVHVSQARPATVEITLERGGTIAGTVRFDDGTPVVGANISVDPPKGPNPAYQYLGMGLSQVVSTGRYWVTDDAGHYRASGLMPGQYTVQVILRVASNERMVGNNSTSRFGKGASTSDMRVYAPATFRKAEAKLVEITRDEVRGDTDIEVVLNGLHGVRGRVQVGEDLHAPGAANISLIDGDFSRYGAVHSDGTYEFDLVPKGTYKLRIGGVYDFADGSSNDDQQSKIGMLYEQGEVEVIVDEHDVVVDPVTLKGLKPKKPQVDGN